MALVAVESIIIEKDQSWIPSHIELLAKLLGVVLSAVYLANVGHIFTSFKKLIPVGLEAFAMAAPWGEKHHEPRFISNNFSRIEIYNFLIECVGIEYGRLLYLSFRRIRGFLSDSKHNQCAQDPNSFHILPFLK